MPEAVAQNNADHATDLFTPTRVGPLSLNNRIVMAPLTRSRAGPGNVPTQLNALDKLAPSAASGDPTADRLSRENLSSAGAPSHR